MDVTQQDLLDTISRMNEQTLLLQCNELYKAGIVTLDHPSTEHTFSPTERVEYISHFGSCLHQHETGIGFITEYVQALDIQIARSEVQDMTVLVLSCEVTGRGVTISIFRP